MDSVSNGGTERLDQSNQVKIADLEQQYIRLLESRILQLEQHGLAEKDGPATNGGSKQTELDTADHDSNVGVNGDHGSSSKGNDPGIKTDTDDPVTQEEPRYAVVITKYDPDTGDFKNIDATEKEEKKVIGPKNRSCRAFTIKKMTLARSRYSELETLSSEVKIEFEPLQKLLGEVTSKWGWSESVATCSSPYRGLVYAWSEATIEARKVVEGEDEERKQARTDLGELLRLISTSSGYLPLDRYFKDRETFLEQKTITHAALWTLFPPGTTIIAQPFLGESQIFTVSSCDSFVKENHTFDLVCFCFDWNGTEFGRVPFEMRIPYWGPDRRSIVELPFYPLQYYTDPHMKEGSSVNAIEKLQKELVERAKLFVQYCTSAPGRQMYKYNGDAHFHTGRSLLHRTTGEDIEERRESDDASSIGGAKSNNENRYISRKKVEGTTMVDFESFFEYLSPNTPILGNLQRYEGELESLSPERRANPIFKEMYKFDWDKHSRTTPLTFDQYLHCPPRVLGYALKPKKWAQLLVKALKAPDKADATVFEDRLQLDEEAKELVKWTVQAHEIGKMVDDKGKSKGLQDFAPDKGKGLIIMLYGFPGVGKTLTAESVALMAGKPLLSVGVSDIGIEGDKVEANLQKVFELAGKWEAVLLFDEADVFLEARGEGENDLKRNAMVSVLLRVLEYYDGILILTTNRMRCFDIAVQSRIHIAIKYDELDSDQQYAIYQSFLEQLKRKKLVENYEDLMQWVKKDGKKYNFNGRQIRNVVSTAMNIALVDQEGSGKLKREHLIRVATKTKEFKQDLKAEENSFKKSQ